jgi:hypothetical protein
MEAIDEIVDRIKVVGERFVFNTYTANKGLTYASLTDMPRDIMVLLHSKPRVASMNLDVNIYLVCKSNVTYAR